MYNTVTEYFNVWYQHLVEMLDRPGGFWPAVKDNSISNDDLAKNIRALGFAGKYNSAVYETSVALMCGRLTGKVKNPS